MENYQRPATRPGRRSQQKERPPPGKRSTTDALDVFRSPGRAAAAGAAVKPPAARVGELLPRGSSALRSAEARATYDRLVLRHRIGAYAAHTQRALRTVWYRWYDWCLDGTQHDDGQPRRPWPLDAATVVQFMYACSPPLRERKDSTRYCSAREGGPNVRAARTVLRYVSCLRMNHKAAGHAGDPLAHPDIDAARLTLCRGRRATSPKDPLPVTFVACVVGNGVLAGLLVIALLTAGP